MKKITYILTCACMMGLSSCAGTFLDLEPLDAKTDLVYFKTPEHFREYATGFYGQLLGWQSSYGGIFEHMDVSSDLSTNFQYSYGVGTGTLAVGTDDGRWNNCYSNIRSTNILFERAQSYSGAQTDIRQSLAEAHFFRAYSYFYLLKFFGGVPIVTKVLDTSSAELQSPRNSRYEVVDFILSDLDEAIAGLPTEQAIANADKGRISRQGAKAFKTRVLLYEATWRKHNGTSTDYEGSAGPARDQVNDFLTECVTLSKEVMDDPAYVLWNYNSNSAMNNQSSYYLFNIEQAESNPGGYGRDTNKEFILYSVYSRDTRKGQIDLNRVVWTLRPSRKMVDMFLCTNGLPIAQAGKDKDGNNVFKGYKQPGDEFANRDYRLTSYISTPAANTTLGGESGYGCKKFTVTWNQKDKDESANYSVLRLAEVYLNYAEALWELNGAITDEQLNNSINKLRTRAGLSKLTNGFVTDNSLDMETEIRRERTVELFMEGFRCDDLKRWGIAHLVLNESRLGMVVGNAEYPTRFVNENGDPTAEYNKRAYTKGEESTDTGAGRLPCVTILKGSDCSFDRTDYLWPIPQRQINLNPRLKQNPGY